MTPQLLEFVIGFGREIEIDAIPAIVQYELAFYRFRSKVVTEEFLKCAFEESLHGVQGPRPYDQFKEGTAMVEANRIISGESEDGYYPFHDQRYTVSCLLGSNTTLWAYGFIAWHDRIRVKIAVAHRAHLQYLLLPSRLPKRKTH